VKSSHQNERRKDRASAGGRRPHTRGRSRERALVGWIWISPWLVGFIAFMALPIAMSLYYSFTDYPLLEPPLPVGPANYLRLVSDPVFLLAVKNTAVYGLVSIPLCTVLAVVLAAMLNARIRGRWFFQAAVFLPTLVPMAASAMIWMWMLNGQYGLINRLLAPIGVQGPNWLLDQNWILPSLVLISLWGIGQAVVTYIAALQDVPRLLYESGAIDGMGPLRRFWHITLPMISPVILFNVIVLVIATIQVFAIPYVLSKAVPGRNERGFYFFTSYLYDNAFVFGQMGYASAMAWVQLLVVLALTGLTFLLSRRVVFYRGI
jgi:multiple sugar transport system permease protein